MSLLCISAGRAVVGMKASDCPAPATTGMSAVVMLAVRVHAYCPTADRGDPTSRGVGRGLICLLKKRVSLPLAWWLRLSKCMSPWGRSC